MKYTKKVLKDVFGSKTEGLEFLKNWRSDSKVTPTLFVYSNNNPQMIHAFTDWLTSITHDADVFAEGNFSASEVTKSTVIIKGVDDVSDELLEEIIACKEQRKKVVVTSLRRPTALDYISDPALKIAQLDDFNTDDVKDEVSELLEELS